MDTAFEYVFPAIRGIQARREYYVSMCPLRLIPKMFLFDEDELVPEIRAQRSLNKARLPEMTEYILSNRDDYVFSAITASIDGDVRFEAAGSGPDGKRLGALHIPMSSRFIINDGQHRRAAIDMALREDPDLADESIAVVFFIDLGLERCQQMFADLNRHAIRPSKSIGVLYDQRDEMARLTKLVVFRAPAFRGVVELEKSTLAIRSRKLFTLSAIYGATTALVDGMELETLEDYANLAAEYWEETATHFPEWKLVRDGKMAASEIRRDLMYSHGVVLQAIGRLGNTLLKRNQKTWKKKLAKLETIDWSRSNSDFWEGRAILGGRVSKSTTSVILTTNVLKKHLSVSLTPEEEDVETNFQKDQNGN